MGKPKGRVLVTGGAGFIGSHIVDRLLSDGYKVFSGDIVERKRGEKYFKTSLLSNAKEIWKKNRKNFQSTFRADVGEMYDVLFMFDWAKPDCVIHCGAQARIQKSIKDPVGYGKSNAVGTHNMLEASRQHHVQKFVYSASSSAYGLQDSMPLVEDMKSDPLNPYALTKYQGEQWVKVYAEIYDVPACSLRYFNVYGPRENPHGQYGTVCAKFLNQWKKGKKFTVVPDGHQRRDFTWIGDVVDANIQAMLCSKKDSKNGSVFNIGYGQDFSVLEVANMIAGHKAKKNVDYKIIKSRIGEARQTLADNEKARKVLGWVPRVSLQEGLQIFKSKI